MARTKTQLQQVDVVGHTQQHGLRVLRLSRTSRSLRQQLPLDCREDTLDLSALTVPLAREALSHLRPDAFDLPRRLPALRGDDAVSTDDLMDVEVVALTVELGIGQHQPDGRHLMGDADQGAQGRAVVVRPRPGRLPTPSEKEIPEIILFLSAFYTSVHA